MGAFAGVHFVRGLSSSVAGAVLTSGDIPQHVKAFIAEQVHSVVELESLVFLQKNPDREWSAPELGRELRIDEQWAEREMRDLRTRGLVVCAEGEPIRCRYAPKSAELDQTVKDLARIYDERRVTVIQLIYSKPTDPIQSFADAFRFRKGPQDG